MMSGVFALLLTALGKATAFGRDVVLSLAFGASETTDAFFIANIIPGIMWAAIHATIGTVMMPLYVARRTADDGSSGRFANEALQAYLILAVITALICIVGAQSIVTWTAPQASADTHALARTLTIIMALGFVFSGYVGVQNAIQQAHGLYRFPLAVPLVNNIIAIVGIAVAAWFKDIRIAVWAAVLGWVVQSPLQRLQTRSFYPTEHRLLLKANTLKRLALLSTPVMLGTFLDQVNIFVGINLAGGMGEGAISQLNYASRLAVFLATTFSMLVAYFLFPRLAASAARGDDRETAKHLSLGVLMVLAMTLPPTVIAYVFRTEIVDMVYGQGALSASDAAGTALAFAGYALGIVFIATREIFNRLFFSYQRMVTPLVLGVIASVVNIVVSRWLGQSMGTSGIALGASIAAMTYILGQVIIILLWKPQLIERRLLIGLAVIGAATVPSWVAMYGIGQVVTELPALLRLVIGTLSFGLPFVAIVGGAAWRLGLLRQIRGISSI